MLLEIEHFFHDKQLTPVVMQNFPDLTYTG